MLEKITYGFPLNSVESQSFFSTFKEILQELPNAGESNDQITIKSINPSNALPVTVIEKSSIARVTIQFESNSLIDKEINGIINDVLVNSQEKVYEDISIEDLYRKIKGHIRRIDHTGINLSASLLSKAKWDELIQKIASISAIYNYPTGENWPFILSVTHDEFNNDITNFCRGREPKFELVYDEEAEIPTLQFDIETDLSREEVEQLFPEPIGQSFKGLEDFFRAVYVSSPYPYLAIRLDISFRNDSNEEWHTGEWLVKEGKRITAKLT